MAPSTPQRGRPVLADDLNRFLANHPRFVPLGVDVAQFFAASRQAFFGSDIGAAMQQFPSGAMQALGGEAGPGGAFGMNGLTFDQPLLLPLLLLAIVPALGWSFTWRRWPSLLDVPTDMPSAMLDMTLRALAWWRLLRRGWAWPGCTAGHRT